jgi:hypothetical protein
MYVYVYVLIQTIENLDGMLAVPLIRHGGAWRERKYSFYSFLASALDGGEWSASRPGHVDRMLLARKDGKSMKIERVTRDGRGQLT